MDTNEVMSDLRQYITGALQDLYYVPECEGRQSALLRLRHALDLVDEFEQAAPVAATVGEAR